MAEEDAIIRAVIDGSVGVFRIGAFLTRLGIWGGRKAHAFYRAHNPPSFSLPPAARFEHTHIVAGSGHGKTEFMKTLLLDDLSALSRGDGSLVVIDSQGDLIRSILTLGMMQELSDRLVLIDPNDIEYPPALNLFDFGLNRLQRYSRIDREKLVNGAIDLYEYVFGALLGAELTQKQGVIFRYLARLMMVVLGATMQTLCEFMQDPETARGHIAKLDQVSRYFFETQFFSNKFDNTREQILTRLWGVRSNTVLDQMFGSARNKLDLFDCMNRGSLILINTAKDLLKQEGCEILGRFFIALICQAAQERAALPENRRRPTFVYIDEAADYFDPRMENLLNQARKYKVGLVLAHQNLDQFDQKLRASIMASTSIKLVGGLSAKDASVFARELRCEPEFLQAMRKYRGHTEFACFVRNHTPEPIRLSIPLGSMNNLPRLSTAEYAAIIRQNRDRYCTGNPEPPKPSGPPGRPLWQLTRAEREAQEAERAPATNPLGIGDPDIL